MLFNHQQNNDVWEGWFYLVVGMPPPVVSQLGLLNIPGGGPGPLPGHPVQDGGSQLKFRQI